MLTWWTRWLEMYKKLYRSLPQKYSKISTLQPFYLGEFILMYTTMIIEKDKYFCKIVYISFWRFVFINFFNNNLLSMCFYFQKNIEFYFRLWVCMSMYVCIYFSAYFSHVFMCLCVSVYIFKIGCLFLVFYLD